MKKSAILFVLFFLIIPAVHSQTYEEMYQKGIKYRNEFKYIEALAIFQVLLKVDSANSDYLSNGSILYSKVGNIQADEKKKMEYFHSGEKLAKKAIASNTANSESHYAYALALGRLNENASSKEKIANAKLIKTEAETAIRLNPAHAGAYHILGRWHRTIADFGFVEKLAINTMFGGVPQGGSYDAAIEAFKNAIKYEPKYLLHYYELAETYHSRNSGEVDKKAAKEALKQALELPLSTPDDPATKKKCEELLKKLE